MEPWGKARLRRSAGLRCAVWPGASYLTLRVSVSPSVKWVLVLIAFHKIVV